MFDSKQLLPDKATITFTESPKLRASGLKVIDSNNDRVDKNDKKVSNTDKDLSTSIDKAKIDPGIYTVNWVVLSKVDGHITKGSYVFSLTESDGQNQTQTQQQAATNVSSQYSKNITDNNVILDLDITPFKASQNTFTIIASYVNGTMVENIKNIYLEFNNPTKNIGPVVDIMERVDTGRYTLTGNFLSQESIWEIEITAQRIGEYDINQMINVNVT
jgi:methionine-rich copper-binding protein CopC